MYSIIIPTMWRSDNIVYMLPIYEQCSLVGEIILIDNDMRRCPELKNFKKLRYIPQAGNIFVNPAWNLGASLAKYKIILANDDIIIKDLSLILSKLDKTDYDVVGANFLTRDKEIITYRKFLGNSWGSFIYIKEYLYIPEQLKIWRGDYHLWRDKKAGMISGIYGEKSKTVNSIEFHPICRRDIVEYSVLQSGEFNVIIRTSNRPNYFKRCVASVKKHWANAVIHVIYDTEKDIEYIKEIAPEASTYQVNRTTMRNFAKKVKIKRDLMAHNLYLNVVKPFLNGWCLVLDDDDELLKTPEFDTTNKNKFYIYKVDVGRLIVPREENFGKRILINDISMIGLIFHSSTMVDFTPQRAGDYQFAFDMSKDHEYEWKDEILSRSQTGNNHAKRNDLV